MNLEPKLQELEAIYIELEKRMADPEVVSNVKEMQEQMRRVIAGVKADRMRAAAENE